MIPQKVHRSPQAAVQKFVENLRVPYVCILNVPNSTVQYASLINNVTKTGNNLSGFIV